MNEKLILILRLHKEGRITENEALTLMQPDLDIEIKPQPIDWFPQQPWRIDWPPYDNRPYYTICQA